MGALGQRPPARRIKPQETLSDYMKRLLTSLNIPIAQYAALAYHETGAPLSVNISQQELLLCDEVIGLEATHYLIVVPRTVEGATQPNITGDPKAGPDLLTVESTGRQFTVNVEFGKTTILELKQKLSLMLKVS